MAWPWNVRPTLLDETPFKTFLSVKHFARRSQYAGKNTLKVVNEPQQEYTAAFLRSS